MGQSAQSFGSRGATLAQLDDGVTTRADFTWEPGRNVVHDEVLVWLQIRPEHGSKKNRDTGYRPAEFGRNGLAEELCF